MVKKAKIHRCPTTGCKCEIDSPSRVKHHSGWPSGVTLKYHPSPVSENDTSSPFLYKCEPCKEVFLFKISSLLKHFHLEHPHLPLPYCKSCNQIFETSTSVQMHKETKHPPSHNRLTWQMIAQADASDLNSPRDDDDVNGWSSPKEVRVQRDPTLAEIDPSTLPSGDILKPLSSVSELSTSSSASSSAAAGPSPSKLDKATALARAALRNRFSELGVLKSGETTPLLISNIFGPRKADSSLSNLDGSCSVATDSPSNNSNLNEKEEKESREIPLNSLDNIIRPSTCPGCGMDFKSFSGFVLHIENRSCTSSMCHEIEDQLDACVTQFFNTLASSGIA